jgi:uncharacterized protein (DUF1501 family)
MPGLHAMYRSGELLILHAVAGPYRTRSHFDAQDYLECGTDHRLTSGWLSRAAAALHPQSNASDGDPIAIGVTIPLLLRGATRVGSWGPSSFQRPPAYLYQAAADLAATDPMIGPALRDGLRERNFTRDALGRGEAPKGGNDFAHLAAAAGQILANPNGPRVAALEMSGFDTHSAQIPLLRLLLGRLDAGLVALKQRIGGAWRDTVVLTMTEFGRTARVNGTKGTDHGTAGVAFLVGGAIAGGRVVADWPGLGSDRLFEGRDLQPTTDLRSVAKGVLAQHLGLNAAQLAKVFPDSSAATSMHGLIRT